MSTTTSKMMSKNWQIKNVPSQERERIMQARIWTKMTKVRLEVKIKVQQALKAHEAKKKMTITKMIRHLRSRGDFLKFQHPNQLEEALSNEKALKEIVPLEMG